MNEYQTFKPGTYAWFHFANKGKEFKTSEGIKTKLDVFFENKKDTGRLERITLGKDKEYVPVKKVGV